PTVPPTPPTCTAPPRWPGPATRRPARPRPPPGRQRAPDGLLPPGHIASGVEREVRAQTVARIRAVLDDEGYETAYAQGGGLSLAEATALV
ncbi:hypothetical protein, partial [Streptomyces sp. NPDC058964]|uniref:hypothetical protein n=1 Tax=Streptomyces sp. NPDC058964 TaxID=3346681 RepID=UPI0036A10528